MDGLSEHQPLLRSSDGAALDRRKSIVSFHEGDTGNPLEWSGRYKWFCITLLCMFGSVVTFTCVGIVPVAGDVVAELEGHRDRSATVLFVTIWELGEAIGPLFIAPLSEIYGRFMVYNIANCLFIIGVIITAVTDDISLLIFARLATGCAVAPNVLNPAIIGDMFPSESRGAAMSAIMLAQLAGGALGPVVSGALVNSFGWRGIMWLSVALAAVIEALFATLLRETYHPTILKHRAARKRKETGDDSWGTVYDDQDQSTSLTLMQSMFRPASILWSSSMLQCLTLWGGLMFSFFYISSTSLPDILEMIYDFTPSQRGLSYLAWTLGSIISIITCHSAMDRIYNALSRRQGKFYPEGRLPLAIAGAFLLPVANVLYGWLAQAHAPVLLFLSTTTILCIAVFFSLVPLMTFITDTFGKYSASALTAVLVTRNLMGAFLPLTVPPLVDNIGNGWAFTVLAGAALALAPIPCLVMRYGPVWRQRSEYTRDR